MRFAIDRSVVVVHFVEVVEEGQVAPRRRHSHCGLPHAVPEVRFSPAAIPVVAVTDHDVPHLVGKHGRFDACRAPCEKIDHALERINDIERHLGINKKIAA